MVLFREVTSKRHKKKDSLSREKENISKEAVNEENQQLSIWVADQTASLKNLRFSSLKVLLFQKDNQ